MKAAIVEQLGLPPVHGDFEAPQAGAGEVVVDVRAAAMSQLVRAIVDGRHYSAGGVLPFVPGVDGVGTLADGSRVYFSFPRAPFGTLAERSVVGADLCVPVPPEVDDVTAAAVANPGMSSWAALTRRAGFVPGETVLVLGATGASGRLAIQIARHLGAGTVVAAGRNPAVLADLPALGADMVLPLDGDAAHLREAFVGVLRRHPVDVVLDYLWGSPAEQLLAAIAGLPEPARVRFVQIGSMAGATIPLGAAVLRSTRLELIGSGIGSVSRQELVQVVGEVLRALPRAGLRLETRALPLAEIRRAWSPDAGAERLVFQPHGA